MDLDFIKQINPIYFLPIIGCLIGWLTNYLAVKMLFHPRKPMNLLFFKIQGVFPKRQAVLANKLGAIVANELLAKEDLAKAIKNGLSPKVFSNLLDDKLEDIITKKLPEVLPALAFVMNSELVSLVKKVIGDELSSGLNSMVSTLGSKLHKSINIEEIVREKVATFSSDKLEEILFSIMKKEFKFIEVIGGVLGFLIGLVQLILVQPTIVQNLIK